MKKQLKTLVNQDFKVMAPYVVRDEGNVPPILMFHFKNIDESVSKAMNTTMQEDFIDVESGFFVPMSRESILQHKEVFMEFMATIMAGLHTVGIAEDLASVVIAVTGKAMKVNPETNEKESEADVFIVSGIDAKGNTFTKAQEIRAQMTNDAITYSLIDSDFMETGVDETANAFIGKDFFDLYTKNVERIPEDKKNLGILEDSQKKYEGDSAAFTADLVDSAMHATILLDSIKQASE